ncbi:hypothetical protein Hanom_Chr15g01386601 [Helianthus anomalus]
MIIPIMTILHMFQLRIRKIPRLKYKIMYPFCPSIHLDYQIYPFTTHNISISSTTTTTIHHQDHYMPPN